jgi:hypothetical protein
LFNTAASDSTMVAVADSGALSRVGRRALVPPCRSTSLIIGTLVLVFDGNDGPVVFRGEPGSLPRRFRG